MDSFDDLPEIEGGGYDKTGVNIIILSSYSGEQRFEKEMARLDSGKSLYLRAIDKTVHEKYLGDSVDNRPHYRYNVNTESYEQDEISNLIYELKESGYVQTS